MTTYSIMAVVGKHKLKISTHNKMDLKQHLISAINKALKGEVVSTKEVVATDMREL